MLKILGRKNSSNVQKVLWCCDELGIPFEREDYGGKFGKTKDAEYLAMNPNATVPTIIDDDLVVWESNSIVRYLANKYDDGTLYPKDPKERALGELWMDWQISVLRGAIFPMFWGSSGPSRRTVTCPLFKPRGKIQPTPWQSLILISGEPIMSAGHVSRFATYLSASLYTAGSTWTSKGKSFRISADGMTGWVNALPTNTTSWFR